ncbi:MAG: NAD(P)-dependent oxidoreductase [Actinomycetota bacterium]
MEVSMKIGFCGLGLMGAPMAARLVEAGHDVTVWNRTAAKTEPLVRRGATQAETPAGAASGAALVITMVADESALSAVVDGPDGLAAAMTPGQTLVEMSTVGPDAVGRLAERLGDGVDLVDAPVLGSIPQAAEGALKVFVGATDDAFDHLRPVLEAFGTPVHIGPLGSGAAMKLVVNATLPSLMGTLGESLALADGLGLDQTTVLDVLADSAIGVTVKSKRSRIEAGDYPPNFKLDLALKDAGLVVEAAEATGRSLTLAGAARDWLAGASAAGMGDLDYSAVLAFIRRR